MDVKDCFGAVTNMRHVIQAYPLPPHHPALESYLHSAGHKERKDSCGYFVVRSNQKGKK